MHRATAGVTHEDGTDQRRGSVPGYRLRLGLTDGRTIERDLSDIFNGPMPPGSVFEPIHDPAYFAQVQLADYGTVAWPNGVDLDPDVLIWGVDADANLLAAEPAEEHA
jgi:Protein of unknown function (DUF2442)